MDDVFLKDLNRLATKFYTENVQERYAHDMSGFQKWISDNNSKESHKDDEEHIWEGQNTGRTVESVISTLIVHLNRYAARYSEAAIAGSDFSAQDDFVYLINLKAFGQMQVTKIIEINVHNAVEGLSVVSRIEKHGWINRVGEVKYDLSDEITISDKGKTALEKQMKRIRQATSMVAGDLSHRDRLELIKILTKLELHHQSVFKKCNIQDLINMMH
ncbi:MarR family transcriptional regulator [Chryseobacterium sp. CFS15]|uniref:MarR family transcriptional regulator n=1 Tax=Chryseobacterium sp. CFS15 TaxID=2986946 RepID=UPI002806E99E|nr:MarR family transcriptional regulator [Chryseobacterium sp. CFS15]MDQ8144420.1 MarR family transcriptional regulator [Chryseobacterium sp. CFS15]